MLVQDITACAEEGLPTGRVSGEASAWDRERAGARRQDDCVRDSLGGAMPTSTEVMAIGIETANESEPLVRQPLLPDDRYLPAQPSTSGQSGRSGS